MNSYIALPPVSELNLRRSFVRLLGVSLLVLLVCGTVLAQAPADHGRPLKVMTRNLYQGTDFLEAMGLTDINQLPVAATTIYANVLATKPELRIAAVAQEIADNTPDLVAVQEATLWEVTVPGVGMTQKTDPVSLLLSDLDKLGESYVQIVVQPEFDFTAPSAYGYVHTTIRNAILARADTLAGQMQVTDTKGGIFNVNLPLTMPAPVGTIYIYRGWAYADITYRGKPLRFLTAHPESFYDPIENAQVYELLTSVGNPLIAGRPVIMAGDFNTNALAAPGSYTRIGYELITGLGGFSDAWAATETKPGFTCCQLNSLLNPKSLLDQRIDFVFTSAGILPVNSKVIGDKVDSRVDSLWPSDHAGLITREQIAD